jgi:Arc/MetJ family transcription regulator
MSLAMRHLVGRNFARSLIAGLSNGARRAA